MAMHVRSPPRRTHNVVPRTPSRRPSAWKELQQLCDELLAKVNGDDKTNQKVQVLHAPMGYGMTLLVEALLSSGITQKLELACCGADPMAAQQLAHLVRCHQNLQHLSLINCHSGGIVPSCILGALGSNAAGRSMLQSLEISGDFLSDTSATAVEQMLRYNTRLHELSIRHGAMTESCQDALLRGLQHNKTLVVLRLAHLSLDDDFAVRLAKVLPSCQLHELDLFHNAIEDDGVNAILQAVCGKQCCGLRTVNLALNAFSVAVLPNVATALQSTHLIALDLYQSDLLVPLRAYEIILMALQRNSTLQSLALGPHSFHPNDKSVLDELRLLWEEAPFTRTLQSIGMYLQLNAMGRAAWQQQQQCGGGGHYKAHAAQNDGDDAHLATKSNTSSFRTISSVSNMLADVDVELGPSGVFILLRERPDTLLFRTGD